MRAMGRASSCWRGLFWHRFGFAHDIMACCSRKNGPFKPPRRFSARFGGLSGGPQLSHNWRHGPSNLLRCRLTFSTLPRAALNLIQTTSQDQLVMHESYDVTPTFKLFRCTQARPLPEQLLFVKSIAMLLTVTSAIASPDLRERQRILPFPEKPAHA